MFDFDSCDHEWHTSDTVGSAAPFTACLHCGMEKDRPIPFTWDEQRNGQAEAQRLMTVCRNKARAEGNYSGWIDPSAAQQWHIHANHWQRLSDLLGDSNPYYRTSDKYRALLSLEIVADPF